MNNKFLESVALMHGYDTSDKECVFNKFEEVFEGWHSHVIVTEHVYEYVPDKPYCRQRVVGVYSDLNILGRYIRRWISDNQLKNDEVTFEYKVCDFVVTIKEKNVEHPSIIQSIVIQFVDYNQIDPVEFTVGNRWFI